MTHHAVRLSHHTGAADWTAHLSSAAPSKTMPDLSHPPSRSDDGDWIDGIEEADCCVCGELIDRDALDRLNEEREPDTENAMCTKCRKADEGDTDDEC